MIQKPHTKSVIFVQPTVPRYREEFFERVNSKLKNDHLSVYASNMDIGAISQNSKQPDWLNLLGGFRRILPGLSWQEGVLSIPVKKNDLLVISGAPRDVTNILLLIKANIVGAQTMWWGHYWSSSSKQWSASLRLKLLRLSNCALFYTDREIKEFREQFPKLTNFPVFALNNGINNQDIKKLRIPYNANKRKAEILFIGRLTSKSKIEFLLEAVAAMSHKEIIIHVIGDGSNQDVFMKLADQLSITKRVKWHGGISSEEKISRIANQCRFFVYPGGVGLSLIHAFNYGLPAIIHNNRWGHMPEISAFKNEVNGVMFKENSIDSLSHTLEGLINDTNRLNAMSKEAVNLTNSTFNTNDMADRFIAAYVSLRKDSKF